MRSLVVGNLVEFNASGRRTTFSPYELELWRRGGDELSDMAAFWGGDDKILVAPRGLDRAWLGDLASRLQWRIEIVEPASHTGSVIDDLLLDHAAQTRLLALIDGQVRVEPWGTTEGVLKLNAMLRAHGVDVHFVGPDRSRLWTVSYLDGKLGLNDLAVATDRLHIPRTAVATSYDQLMGLVHLEVKQGRPFVVKSNVGVGGFGTFIVDPELVRQGLSVMDTFVEELGEQPIFREGPFLVQDWVEAAPDALRPTFDGEVMRDGRVRVVGTGGMIVDIASYRGVAVGASVLAPETTQAVMDAGLAVGEAAARLGYAGWYDVDFVLGDDGTLYATEINARRTSPTHAFALLERWRELDGAISCVIADDDVALPRPLTWEELSPAVTASADDRTRCIVTIARRIAGDSPYVGLAVGAPDLEAACAALAAVRDRLAAL